MNVLFFLFLKQGDSAEKQKESGRKIGQREKSLFLPLFTSDYDSFSSALRAQLTHEVPKKKKIELKGNTEP